MSYERLFVLVRLYVVIAAAAIIGAAIALWFTVTRHGLLAIFAAALLLKLWVIYESVRRRAIHTGGKLVEYEAAPGRFGLNVAAMIAVSVAATVSVFVILYLKG